eukprot:626760_1
MSATRRGVCFRNLGNTCYIDSVLILYGSDPRLVQRECECKDCVSNEFCLLKSAHNLIKRQQESKHKISPTTIYNNLHSINHARKSIPKPLINAPDVADVDNKLLSNVDGEQMAGDESDSSTENSSGYSESYFEAQREKQIDDIIQRKQMKIVTIHHEQGSSKYVYELIGTQDVNVQRQLDHFGIIPLAMGREIFICIQIQTLS